MNPIKRITCKLTGWWDNRRKRIHLHNGVYTSGFINRKEQDMNKTVSGFYCSLGRKIREDYRIFTESFMTLVNGEKYLASLDPAEIIHDATSMRKKEETVEYCEIALAQCTLEYDRIRVAMAETTQEIQYCRSCANQMIAAYLQGAGIDPRPDGIETTVARLDETLELAFCRSHDVIGKFESYLEA